VVLVDAGAVGFGTLLCTVGSKRRREGKECFAERTEGARPAGLRNEGSGFAASQGILFLPAWQLFAVQKACQSPHAPARCHPGFAHRCATGEAPVGLSSAFIRGFNRRGTKAPPTGAMHRGGRGDRRGGRGEGNGERGRGEGNGERGRGEGNGAGAGACPCNPATRGPLIPCGTTKRCRPVFRVDCL